MPTPIGISGSRAAAVLGLSPYQTPVQVWLDIMGAEFCHERGYEWKPFEGNTSTRWGSAFESAIVELTENKLGVNIIDREKYFEREYLTCHVDGIINGDTLYEAKTTTVYGFSDAWGEPGSNKIPRMYQVQVQHNMMLAGLERAVVAVLVFPKRVEEFEEMGWLVVLDDGDAPYLLDPDGRILYPSAWADPLNYMGYFHTYEINADHELQNMMLKHYAEFWQDHVIGRTEPKARNIDDIKKLCREPKGTIIADDFIERIMSELDQLGDEKNQIDERRDQIKLLALEYMRDQVPTIDEETETKYILRSRDGRKLGQYGKDKNGRMSFR